jgi:hypothetical protein
MEPLYNRSDSHGINRKRGLVGSCSSASPFAVEKRKNSSPLLAMKLVPPSFSPQPSHYTNLTVHTKLNLQTWHKTIICNEVTVCINVSENVRTTLKMTATSSFTMSVLVTNGHGVTSQKTSLFSTLFQYVSHAHFPPGILSWSNTRTCNLRSQHGKHKCLLY